LRDQAKNKDYLKAQNQLEVLDLVNKSAVSRSELAGRTGLTKAGIGLIVKELVRKGAILETGAGDSAHGRKPVLLEINAGYRHVLALNLSRVGCRIGLTDLKGRVLATKELPLPDGATERTLDAIVGGLENLVLESGISRKSLLGLGISAPGPLDATSGIILNPPGFDRWHDVAIVSALHERLSLPAFLENNAAALALAERNLGIASGLDSFLLLVVDSGIGAGIVVRDGLYRGTGGFGSEIGHTSIDWQGPPCRCGNRGCLETLASIPAVLSTRPAHRTDLTTWVSVVDGVFREDADCLELIDREAEFLAAGILNAMNILELQAVVLSGWINDRPEPLVERISARLQSRSITRGIHRIQVLGSGLVRDPEIVSSSAIVIDRFFRGSV
jgi:predicted NBD/HSP70 family sugar kinase